MYELQEGHRIIENMMRQFCEKEIAPHVEAIESGELLPFEVIRKMMNALGMKNMIEDMLTKAIAKEEKGEGEAGGKRHGLIPAGSGELDPMIMAVATKELARVSPSVTLSLSATLGLCGATIMAKGTPAQKRKYGIPVMTLQKIGCWGMTEPEAGSDAFALRTIARPEGDGYVINGSKTFITNAPYADVFVIYAKIDRGGASKTDKQLVYPFVLERGIPGLSTSKPMKKMGMCGSPTGEIFLEDVKAGKEHLLGESEERPSRDQAKDVFATERGGSPFLAWGIIERCLDDCIKYSIQRKQFGKSLAEFQLIQEKIARMYVNLEIVKLLAMKQAWMMKEGKGAPEEYCAAKYFSAQAAVETGLIAIQLMGGYGYMKEYHVEMLMRDAKLIGIGGGTDEVQLLTIAKSLLRKHGCEVSLA